MFGVINVNVAGALLSKTDKAGQSAKNAYFGAFILGIAFAITSFSCTVPVVGMLLVVAASGTATGLLTSLLGMTVYGVVFAFPFVILSLFPSSPSPSQIAGHGRICRPPAQRRPQATT